MNGFEFDVIQAARRYYAAYRSPDVPMKTCQQRAAEIIAAVAALEANERRKAQRERELLPAAVLSA